jgi:DNA-binding MarR family transcriptional regulator
MRMALVPLLRQLRRHNVDLTPSQASALATIDKEGPLTVGELARAEGVSSPMVTKVAKALEEMGLVTRTPDVQDRRVCLVALTLEGRRRLERNRVRKNAWLAKRLRTLSPDDLAALAAAIPVIERISGGGE